MDQKLQQQALKLTEQIMNAYFCQRDIHTVLNLMAPDATWIGPGEREKKYTLDEIRTYFELAKDFVPSCDIFAPDLHVIDLDEHCCMVTGSMVIRTTPESELLLEVNQRISATYRYRDGRLQLVHLHNSNPYGEMEQDEYFPHRIGAQSYQYLQRLLREKTEVLDMIAGNIDGGLKGSNDDDTFSFFYVNEGLPRMLGYTYDEFMEKSGGTAVGASYPPDMPAALADCIRCFSQGPSYSTEYRMEKKDGSLIWVQDTGRKMVDNEGITRINSIITDITPLKRALFDLEVERERYRIALEHITGAMCEYDVEKDLFTLYRQTDLNGKCCIRQSEIPDFSQVIGAGALADAADGAAFLARCKGKVTGSMELRTRLPYQNDAWYWVQFSCSVIYDRAGVPVRTIGMLKDITEERARNMALLDQAQHDGLTGLLNQTSAREAIQSYLTMHCDSAPSSALIMVDLDRFKEVNDFNGHAYGDKVLVETAGILAEVMGDNCIVGRIGGDEFLALVPCLAPESATRLAEEIVRRVRSIDEDRDFAVSCSVGVAHRKQGEPFAQFFERADRALYQAKNDGRNRYAVDG